MWRSLVAYTSGGRRVAGSNPVIPTSRKNEGAKALFFAFSGEVKFISAPDAKKKENTSIGKYSPQ